MIEGKEGLILLVLSPWSLWLKKLVRETVPGFIFRQVGYQGRDALFPAWLYWLLDGDEAAAGAVLKLPQEQPNSADVKFQLFSDSTRVYDIAFSAAFKVKVTDFTSGEPVFRVFPEGDGLYYRELEIQEQGESNVLPGKVIDEAFIFADSVIKSFDRKV